MSTTDTTTTETANPDPATILAQWKPERNGTVSSAARSVTEAIGVVFALTKDDLDDLAIRHSVLLHLAPVLILLEDLEVDLACEVGWAISQLEAAANGEGDA